MPTLTARLSKLSEPPRREPTTKDALPVSPKEKGQCISLTDEGWQKYFKNLQDWWNLGPCLIHRMFRYDKLNRMWVVMLYRVPAKEHEMETYIVGTAEEKKLIRTIHGKIAAQLSLQPLSRF